MSKTTRVVKIRIGSLDPYMDYSRVSTTERIDRFRSGDESPRELTLLYSSNPDLVDLRVSRTDMASRATSNSRGTEIRDLNLASFPNQESLKKIIRSDSDIFGLFLKALSRLHLF